MLQQLKKKKPSKPQERNGQAIEQLLLEILPSQGEWNDEEYLWLTDRSKRLIEFTDGRLEVLPMPTDKHQAIIMFLLFLLKTILEPKGGKVRFSGLRVKIRPGKFREPDLVALLAGNDPRRANRFWSGADLAIEVVSEDDPKRDTVEKPIDYAEGKIPEYWIVNPLDETITILALGKKRYRKQGVFRRGQKATSILFPEFSVDVDSVFDAD